MRRTAKFWVAKLASEKPRTPLSTELGLQTVALAGGWLVTRQSCSENPAASEMFLLVVNLVALSSREGLGRIGSLGFRNDVGP